MKQRGFTILEIVIASSIFALLFGAAAAAVARDQETHRALTSQIGPELPARQALERMSTELRMAGEWAEDRDHDGELDPGEDSNGNGALEAAWNLADGVVDQEQIRFNRRIDLKGPDGELLASGIYSRAVGYRLDGTDLVREWEHEQEDGSVILRRTVIARHIGGLHFSRDGVLVTVALDVIIPERAYAPGRRTLTARVWLRN